LAFLVFIRIYFIVIIILSDNGSFFILGDFDILDHLLLLNLLLSLCLSNLKKKSFLNIASTVRIETHFFVHALKHSHCFIFVVHGLACDQIVLIFGSISQG